MHAKRTPDPGSPSVPRDSPRPAGGTDPERSELVCALCGREFGDKPSLARHNLSPHFRSNRARAPVSVYQALN